MKKIKICIISEEAYPYFKGKGSGGSELQMTLLAKNLLVKGYEIYFITFSKEGNFFENMKGINVYNPYFNKKKGWTHFLPNNLYKFLSVLKKIEADIYIQRAGPLTTFLIKIFRKKYVYSVSDNNSVTSNLKIKKISDLKYIFHILSIKFASCVFCQTEYQRKALMNYTSLKSKVIRNIFIPNRKYKLEKKRTILWVGRIIPIKSPEIYIELAKSLPNYNFKMIGGKSFGDEQYYKQIHDSTKTISNLEFLGPIPHDKIYEFYAEAGLFINTSSSEGFPNTFLEAWANKTPIISLNFDPDEVISKNELGFYCSNFEELKVNTNKLMNNDDLRERMSINSLKYVEINHGAEKIIKDYEKAFKILIS